jgi:hypothetical protein
MKSMKKAPFFILYTRNSNAIVIFIRIKEQFTIANPGARVYALFLFLYKHSGTSLYSGIRSLPPVPGTQDGPIHAYYRLVGWLVGWLVDGKFV